MCGLTACLVLQQQLHGSLPTGTHTNGYAGPNGNVHVNGFKNGETIHGKQDARVNGNGNCYVGTPEKSLETEMDESLEIIKHRGPDARGVWISPNGRVGKDFCL